MRGFRNILQGTTQTVRRRLAGRSRRSRCNRFMHLELLEDRSLMAVLVADALSGTSNTRIEGTVYEDLDSSGTRGADENGLEGWTVYLDLDNSGTLNTDAVGATEPSVVTDNDGQYEFRNLRPSTYRVSEILIAGWTATAPISRDVVVAQSNITRANFFNFGGGTITGAVWNDRQGDGIRDVDPDTGAFTEPGLAGWTVFLDLNDDRMLDSSEPSTLTDENGIYSFENLPPGDYEVTEILPDGWEPSPGFDLRQTAAVVPLETTTLDFANFSFTNGSIRGVVWHDLNINGVRDTDPLTGEFVEPGLEGWSIFLDLNHDSIADADEPQTLTDVDGNYFFSSLVADDYRVTEIIPEGWAASPEFDTQHEVTVLAGEESVADDFANFNNLNGSLRGIIWNDLNRNGLRDTTISGEFTEPGLQNWMVYLDLNGNGELGEFEPTALTDADGYYTFIDLQVGEYEAREILPTGWETAPTFDDNHAVRVFPGTESVVPDFANYLITELLPGSVAGTIWNDLNGNGFRDSAPDGTIIDIGLSAWTVFADLNGNGTADAGEPQSVSGADGAYLLTGISPGTVTIVESVPPGWRPTSPPVSARTIVLRNDDNRTDLDFGNERISDATIHGTVFSDNDRDGARDLGERGLSNITVYLDTDGDSVLDDGEERTTTSADLFYTPSTDESGSYSFTHLAPGNYTVRVILPEVLSATPATELSHTFTLGDSEDRVGVDTAAVFRSNEIHGVRFNDTNGNHERDLDEHGVRGITVYIDLDRDNSRDVEEPATETGDDGSYSFTGLHPGAYVVREVESPEIEHTYPTTTGGILWPDGTSNPAVGIVDPTSITTSLDIGESHRQTVSITLPNSGALTNLVDVFLLFDDTGSFVNNSPIVRSAFPDIITSLQGALPGINLAFGVGRLEEYGNFAAEYDTGRPFILNQPMVAASTPGYMTAIQEALDRTTPGYGGDEPETDIEALYQLVSGVGFDGNNNGSLLDSGPAGLSSTQLTPGSSGDVPPFASFQPDPAASVLPAAGTVGGAGFRAGALPIILTATDTGFAYQPKSETNIVGLGGLSLPISSLTNTSRPTTPFGAGAGIQETVTALNALGALVIGLGTNTETNFDPRQGLEALSLLTGAINRSTSPIDNGTPTPIAPGEPLYFQIASGFAASVANGVVNAIQNAVTSVAVDIDVRVSDPRVRLINHSGIRSNITSGQTASFDVEFTGDGIPHRFDLQFVRAGTNVVLGSLPVVLGTPIPGDGYEFEDLDEGEIEYHSYFGGRESAIPINHVPVAAADLYSVNEDGTLTISIPGILVNDTDVDGDALTASLVTGPAHGELALNSDGSFTYTPSAGYVGGDSFQYRVNDGVANSLAATVSLNVTPVNDAPVANDDSYAVGEDGSLVVSIPGILANDVDVDGDTLSATLVTGPAHGELALNSDGSFTYTPSAGYVGGDSFQYRVNDGVANSLSATVSLNVTPVNDAPVANNDSYTVGEDGSLVVSIPGVLANDSDVDGDILSATLVTGPAHGELALNSDGSFTYTPSAGYVGGDSFQYRVNDGVANSLAATVSLNVTPVNDAPVANDDSYAVGEDGSLVVSIPGILANDSDVDGDTLSATLVTGPSHGELALNSDGSFTYTPSAGYVGGDSFQYRVNDGVANSLAATVSLNVTPVNDAPVANNDSYTVGEDGSLVVSIPGVLANDVDVDGDILSATLVTGPAHGELALNSDGSFTYTPSAGYVGGDSFQYRVNDGVAESLSANVSINIVPDGTEFVVVENLRRRIFTYSDDGALLDEQVIRRENKQPVGIATSPDGSITWVLDGNGMVRVYDRNGDSLGAWRPKELEEPEGIATDGSNLWIVDRGSDKVHYFHAGALRRFGEVRATSSFRLAAGNKNAMDIATDGTKLWVVNDASATDKVFRYLANGTLEGSWSIDQTNSRPTGITLNPNHVDDLWIVDSRTDRVYQYAGGAERTSGTDVAASSFGLADNNRDPQGIAFRSALLPETSSAGRTIGAPLSASTPVAFAAASLPRVASPSGTEETPPSTIDRSLSRSTAYVDRMKLRRQSRDIGRDHMLARDEVFRHLEDTATTVESDMGLDHFTMD